MQEKLFRLFKEPFQVKRTSKQINEIKQLNEKSYYAVKMAMIKNQCLNFYITLKAGAFKNTKISNPQEHQVKITLRSNYPAQPPNLYFLHNNMLSAYLRPFRNYLNQVLGSEKWSAKFTILQLIKMLPQFIENHSKLSKQQIQIPPVSFRQYFQIDTIFSWKFCQVHPIQLVRGTSVKQGFIVINVIHSEITVIDETFLEQSFSTCDFFKGNQITAVRKNKKNPQKLLIQVKLKYPTLSGQFGIQVLSQDYDALIFNLMDCAKSQKLPETQNQSEESSSEEEVEGNQRIQSSEDININEVQESIIVYESMVDSKMTSQNVSQLVLLLKKAIQYYSALNDARFKQYLQKLQNVLSNQMAQVLLQSQSVSTKKPQPQKQEPYKSILDLL